MPIPIRTRLYPKSGSSSIIQNTQQSVNDLFGGSLFSKATSALQNTPFGQVSSLPSNPDLVESLANQGVSATGNIIDSSIGNITGSLGGSLGNIVGGDISAMSSDRLSSFLQSNLGNNANDWFQGPAQVLATTNGLTFPATTTIQLSNTASYDQYELTHSNYTAYAYKSSNVDNITISGKFPINCLQEADYFLGAIHFLRSVTKSHFGENDTNKGVPPPVLLLDALGPDLIQQVPVIVLNFSTTFDETYDLVSSSSGTFVPTLMTLSVQVAVYQDPSNTAKVFSLDDFRSGKLASRGYI